MDKVRNILLEMEFKVFAPYYDGVVLTKENDSPEMRKKVFDIDIGSIDKCDLVVAIIDDFDCGVIFEVGYAYRGKLKPYRIGNAFSHYLEKIPIIAYSDISGRGLNVMLQVACEGFANGPEELKDQLSRLKSGVPLKKLEFSKGDVI